MTLFPYLGIVNFIPSITEEEIKRENANLELHLLPWGKTETLIWMQRCWMHLVYSWPWHEHISYFLLLVKTSGSKAAYGRKGLTWLMVTEESP